MDNFNLIVGKSNSTSNMVQVNNFSVTIGPKKLFDDSELVLSPGNIYGLIGKNGCGKTTLLKMIANHEFPINDRMLILHVEQEIVETEQNPVELLMASNGSFYKHHVRIQELEEIMSSEEFGEMENSDEIMEEYEKLESELRAVIPEAEEAKIRKILKGLGFTELTMDQPSNLFSGGWKMRISLAKSLYIEPDLLLLDEPTNHLDLEAVVWLGYYLETVFPSKKKMALVVSHNVGFLNQVTTHTLNIEKGKLVTYKGNYNSFKYNFKKKQVHDEKEWGKIMKKKKGKSKKEFDEILKKSELKEPDKPYNVSMTFSEVPIYSNNVISVDEVSFSYGDKIIFDKISFGADMNSRITLIGRNGIGKTTLLKLIMGELKPNEGMIVKQNGLRIGYYHQHFESLLPKDKTPIEYLEETVPEDLICGNRKQTVRKYLGTLKLESEAHNSTIGNLSGGQKARVALISLLFQQPHFILLDEPTNHLDIETVEALIDGLKEYEGGLMVITHEPEMITNLESELWILENNKITFYNNSFDCYCDSLFD
jgi:ATP-binding cassette, subfamily F, member 1